MSLQTGDVFYHYEIRAYIAQGGTSDVYRALDTLTGREVALKIPKRTVVLDPVQYEYFLREVEAMNILHHPAVQHGLESGHFDTTPYLVTDLVDGKSLRKLLKENGPLPVERAINLTCKIAEGLAYCHEQDVIHRDIKPENVLIINDDQPVILDFGLAISNGRPGRGKAAGTSDYVAPEQIEGQECDRRTDVYTLGALLYELLTGKPPFVGKDVEDVIKQHLYGAAPRLDRDKPGVSPQVATVVSKCLQRDPDRRYADMYALIEDLTHLDKVDIRQLDALTTAPPGPSFFQTQVGQVLLMLAAFVVVTTVLTILGVALKPIR